MHIDQNELDQIIAGNEASLRGMGGNPLIDLLNTLGGGLGNGVKEISRRRLACAIHAMADPTSDPAFAQFNHQMATAEYTGFGGDPADVFGDWVSAHSDTFHWRPVPADRATFDTTTGRWTSEWVDASE